MESSESVLVFLNREMRGECDVMLAISQPQSSGNVATFFFANFPRNFVIKTVSHLPYTSLDRFRHIHYILAVFDQILGYLCDTSRK
jgi:hypothetical protein